MGKNQRNTQELSTPKNVDSKIIITSVHEVVPNEKVIITSVHDQEVTNAVEFELMPDSQEVTPQAETPAEVIDNTAMLIFMKEMKEMKEQQAKQAEEFNLKFAEQQELIESLAKEKEELKAKATKIIDPVEIEKRLKEIRVCEERKDYLQRKLDELKTCKRNPQDTFVTLTNEPHDIVFNFNDSVFVSQLLDNMMATLLERIAEKDQEIQSLKTLN